MEYDKKIDDRAMILNCLDVDSARDKYENSYGYFTDDIQNYSNLNKCGYGKLITIGNSDIPYKGGNGQYFRFFLPESAVKKEKKYRPFIDAKEFFIKTNFEAGDLIHIRSKPHNDEYYLLIIGWTDEGLMLGNFSEMTFDELLDKFELWDGEDNEDKFIPFGVEE